MVDRMHVPYLAPLDDDEPWQHAPSQGSQGRHTAANSTLQNSRGRGAALRLEELSLQRLEELEDGMVSHDGNLFVAHDGALVGDVSHVSHLAGLAGRAHPRADLPWLEAMDDARLHPAVNSARRVFRLQVCFPPFACQCACVCVRARVCSTCLNARACMYLAGIDTCGVRACVRACTCAHANKHMGNNRGTEGTSTEGTSTCGRTTRPPPPRTTRRPPRTRPNSQTALALPVLLAEAACQRLPGARAKRWLARG
jgi:hypothetical protein